MQKANDPWQCDATDALRSIVAQVMLPLSIVYSLSFKTFVGSLDSWYIVPSWENLSTTLLAKKT